MTSAGDTVETVYRREAGRIIASLIRVCGSFDLAEEALQEALTAALLHWPEDGIPANPAAWLTAVARRKLIDLLRRQQVRQQHQVELDREPAAPPQRDDEPDALEPLGEADDRLRLIFTCCHPALNREAQIALTLRTLGGLTTREIARAFLLPDATLAQRLVRAQNKIRTARIPYEVPRPEALPERLASVRTVLYLIFTEGYAATGGEQMIRASLCEEAIRLARTLHELMPGTAESMGLLALMLLHDSRREARLDPQGELVPLEEQDRSRWNRERIAEGVELLEQALRIGPVGPFQLQAAIAAVHAHAATAAETDWEEIAQLYAVLLRINPSPVIALNHAVAVAMSAGLERGLALIEEIQSSGRLDGYYLLPAARADLLRRLGRGDEAIAAYRQALDCGPHPTEQRYLQRRLEQLLAGRT